MCNPSLVLKFKHYKFVNKQLQAIKTCKMCFLTMKLGTLMYNNCRPTSHNPTIHPPYSELWGDQYQLKSLSQHLVLGIVGIVWLPKFTQMPQIDLSDEMFHYSEMSSRYASIQITEKTEFLYVAAFHRVIFSLTTSGAFLGFFSSNGGS